MRSVTALFGAVVLTAGLLTATVAAPASAGLPVPAPTAPISTAPISTAPISAAPISAAPQHFSLDHLCAVPTPGHRGCFALKVVPTGVVPTASPDASTESGYGPADLAGAYNMPGNSGSGGSGVTVAIVDAYDDPTAEADLSNYRSNYGLSACTTANGCFSKVSQRGSTTALPATDTGWSGEIALDIEMVSAGCPHCHILLVESDSAGNGDLDTAVNYAAAHAQVVSNSYGGPEYDGETSDDASYNHPGVSVLASSGDGGYGVEYPAASAGVIAVGGTSLSSASGTRGWTEAAWSNSDTQGAGSGCSAGEAKPAWQVDTGCANRTVADVSAVADPATGVAVYDTTGGSGWTVYGGTSVSSPLVAAILAATGHAGVSASYLYANPGVLYDVSTGQTSSGCSSYLCKAGPGYDGPTGLGTPDGQLMAGGTPGDFSLALSPTSGSEVAGSSTTTVISTATTSGSAQSVTLGVSGLPAGVTGTFNPPSVTSGASSTLTLSSGSSATPATATLTITGTAPGGSHGVAYSLTVTAPPPPVQDFSITATAVSVTTGASSASTIATATTSGAAQTIALSTSGAPGGVRVTLDPGSVTSGSTSTATVAAAAGTAAGSYRVTITGRGTSGSHSVVIILTVRAAASRCAAGQKLLNSGFESGAHHWTATAGVIRTDRAHAHVGTGYAWLDGYGSAHTDTVAQTVTVPAGCSSVVLSFWLDVSTTRTTSKKTTKATASDKLTVTAGGAVVATYSNLTAAGWVRRSMTVSAAPGKAVTVTFKGVQTSAQRTSFWLDDTALTAS